MPTVEVSIAADASDGFAIVGDNIYTTINETGTNSGTPYHCWLHFANVTVPQGVTIDVAYLILERKSYGSGTVKSLIYAIDEDNSPAPTTYAAWATDHGIHTTASTTWDFTPAASGAQNSPSIVTVIQEIVDRASWASGNTLGIHIDDNTTGGTNIYQEWEDYADTTAPKLHIEYTAGLGIVADLATATVTAYAPTISGGSVNLVPDLATATITAYAPTVGLYQSLVPDLATATITPYLPVVSGGVELEPSIANLFLDAEAFWQVSEYGGSGDLLDLTENGHDAVPSGATFKDHTTGTNYAWLPGTASNSISVPLPSGVTTAKVTWIETDDTENSFTTTDDPIVLGATSQTGDVKEVYVEDNADLGIKLIHLVTTDYEPETTALSLDGTTDHATVPHDVAFTSDNQATLRVEWEGTLSTFTADDVFIAKWTAPESWLFRANTGDKLAFYFKASGTQSAVATRAISTWANYLGVAAELDLTTGIVTFEVKNKGGAWEHFETVDSGSGAVTLEGTGVVSIGAKSSGGENVPVGQFHHARIIGDGVTVLNVDFTTQKAGAATFTAETGQTVTLANDAEIVADGQLRIHDTTPTVLDFPGTSNDHASVPESFMGGATNVEWVWRLNVGDWIPASNTAICSDWLQGGITDTRSWIFALRTTGFGVFISDIGSTAGNFLSPTSIETVLTANQPGWVKAIYTGGANAQVEFFASATQTNDPDAVAWVSLGTDTTVDGTGDADVIYDSGSGTFEIGVQSDDAWDFVGQMLYGQIKVAGVVEFERDFTTLPAGVTTFVEESENAAAVTLNGNAAIVGGSQQWTVNRATSGYTTTIVGRQMFVLDGVDDHLEVADDDGLDSSFDDADDSTWLIFFRTHDLTAGDASYGLIGKSVAHPASSTGWGVFVDDHADVSIVADSFDGTTRGFDEIAGILELSAPHVVGGRIASETIEVFSDGVTGGTPVARAGNLANSAPLRIGSFGGATTPSQIEFYAAGVWRRKLTDAEILEAYQRLLGIYKAPAATLRVEIGFTAAILDTTITWTDITPYVYRLSTRRGRNFELNRFEAGTLELEVNNQFGLFDPANTGVVAPYSGNIRPLKHIRVLMDDPSTEIDVEDRVVFRGYIESWGQSGHKRYTTRVRAADTLKALNGYRMGPRYQTAVIADDPIAFFLLDETTGTTVKDSGSVGGDGTLDGTGYTLDAGSPFIDGGMGTSVDIDEDSTARVTLPANANLHDTSGDGYTVEAWVYLDSTKRGGSGISYLFDFLLDTDPIKPKAVFLAIHFGRTGVSSNITGGGETTFFSENVSLEPTADQWVHWVCVFTADRRLHVYHDGVRVVDANSFPRPAGDIGITPANYLFNDTDPPVGTGTNSFHGKVSGLAFYNKPLNQAAVTAHYEAGLDSFISQTLHARTVSALDHLNWPTTRRTLDTGSAADPYHTLAVTPLNNETAFQFLATAAESVGGELLAAADGNIVLRGRHWRAENQTTSLATFGDATGEIGYSDLTYSIDDQYVATHVTATGANRTTYRVEGDEYDSTTDLRRDISLTAGQVSDTNITQARAEWYAHVYQTARNRINSITFPPHASTAATTQAIYREIGDRITIKRRPPGGYTVEADYYIEAIRHTITRNMLEWETTWQLSPATPTTDIALANTDTVGSGASTDKVIGW